MVPFAQFNNKFDTQWVNQKMMMAMQILVCLVFIIVFVFWAGKRFGQRRFIKNQEEMQALELSFKHLMDDMEMVSSHNMKILEASSSDLKELLTVADKKCLHAYDLLQEIDESLKELKKRNSGISGVTSIDSAVDRKFRKEVQEVLEETLNKLQSLSHRIAELEDNIDPVLFQPEIEFLIKQEVERQLLMMKSAEKNDEANEKIIPLRTAKEGFASAQVAEQKLAQLQPAIVAQLKTVNIEEKVRFPSAVKKTDLQAPPPMNYHVKEVLDMVEQGVTLPQIARNLKMGKGEVELILKFYGERANMRKIM